MFDVWCVCIVWIKTEQVGCAALIGQRVNSTVIDSVSTCEHTAVGTLKSGIEKEYAVGVDFVFSCHKKEEGRRIIIT